MIKKNKDFTSLCVSLLALFVIFNGCENPGSVGNSFTDSPVVLYDTLTIDNTTQVNYPNGYSGNFPFTTAGKYNDQLFGEITATSLLKPIRATNIPDSVDLTSSEYSMKLKIKVDSADTFGDTLSVSEFSIYEITSLWRGTSHRINTEVTYNEAEEIGNFMIGSEDSLIVELSDSWKDKYAGFINSSEDNVDSLYRYEFHGLAIVPKGGSSKLSYINTSETQFLITDDAQTDTTSIRLRKWGYGIERIGQTQPEGTTPLHTSMESAMKFPFPTQELIDKHKNSNILKSELVFYSAEDELNSYLPTNHNRPNINLLGLNFQTVDDDVFEYQLTDPDLLGSIIADSAYFKVPVNTVVNNLLYGEQDQEDIIVGIGSSSGVLRSTLLYNSDAVPSKKPKLIITYVVNEDN